MGKFIDLTNEKFGRLTVVERVENNRFNQTQWKCICDCGKEKIVQTLILRNGHCKSCGCFFDESHRTHNMYKTVMYQIHHGMISRCRYHKDYHGRNITVCERWSGPNGFLNFLEDMGERPSDKHSIERINNDGNYEPSNCKWATTYEQKLNKRSTKLTPQDVEDIRNLYETGEYSYASLGRKYNCDGTHIRKTVLGLRWK